MAREGVKASLVPHKTFAGDRPSVSLLLPRLDAYYVGHLLALYENHVAVCVGGEIWLCEASAQTGR